MELQALDERKRALEKRFMESRPPLAYAKLSGRILDDTPFESLVTHLPVELGRGPVSKTPGPRISLGEQKSISRQHARIQWNQQKCCFEVMCLGKNGMFAAGKFVSKDQTVELVSKMPLKIGHARVYFLSAIRSTCSTMSGGKMLQKAFEKAKNAAGLTADEASQQILDLFPRSEGELGGKANLRLFVTNYLDEDTQTFEKVAGTNPPRYKIKTLNGSIGAAVDPTTSDGDAARKKQKTDAGK